MGESEELMKTTTVLLTGAGGVVIPYLIQSLREKGYRVLAADMDPSAVGLYLAERGFTIPPGDSPRFLPVIRTLCKKEGVDVIIPLVDEELVSALELEADGIITLTPRRDFVVLCLDKYRLALALKEAGVPAPRTRLADSKEPMEPPFIVKPRRGRGSRDVHFIRSAAELASFRETHSDQLDRFLMQEYIAGKEFTVSVVAWRDGEVMAVVPKEIISKKGVTRSAVTRRNRKIEDLCSQIQQELHADGPFNVQLRLDAVSGDPIPFEINPRFSTTVSLTIAAGIDEVHGLIARATGRGEEYSFGEWKEGVVLLRQTLDTFIDEEEFYRHPPIDASNLADG